MAVGDWFRMPFAKPTPAAAPVTAPVQDEAHAAPLLPLVAYAESQSANGILTFDGIKYNPDDLLSRKGDRIYQRMMLDEQVKAVVRFKQAAITSRQFIFELNDESLSEEERARRIALFEKLVQKMGGSFKVALKVVLRSMWQGFSISEKEHARCTVDGKTYVYLRKLHARPFETFFFRTDPHGQVQQLVQRYAQGQRELELPVPMDRVVYMVANADMDPQYGQSELREAYRDYFSKDYITKLRNIYLERAGSGFVAITQDSGSTLTANTPDHIALTTFLKNASSNAGVLLPRGCTLTVTHPGNTDAFERGLIQCNLGIAKALLVPNLMGVTETGQTGAFAQSQTQFEAFLWTLDDVVGDLEEVLNEQVFAELGRMNFADGIAPRIKFKPLSEDRKFKLLAMWKDLITAGAVSTTTQDENQLRDMLDMPRTTEDGDDDAVESVSQNSGLNGAQVTAMVDLLTKVAAGIIPPDTAVEVIYASYPVSRTQAESIVADVKVTPAAQPPSGTQGSGAPAKGPSQPAAGGSGTEDAPVAKDAPLEETVRGKVLKDKYDAARVTAQRRVAFAVINRRTQALEATVKSDLLEALSAAVKSTLETALADGVTPEAIEAGALSRDAKTELKRIVRGMLQQTWDVGIRHATDEVEAARRAPFSADFGRLGDMAAQFFDARAFSITGKLSSDVTAIIQREISNGLRNERSIPEIREEVYASLARAGYLDEAAVVEGLGLDAEEAAEFLGRMLVDAGLQAHRLDTIIRTNLFETLNEARYDYFTDPQLGGFVEAFEYSAILDDNTTELCNELHGHTWAADSDVWDTYTPPNHFNCRSLLIPIIRGDVWTESPAPTVEPAEGF